MNHKTDVFSVQDLKRSELNGKRKHKCLCNVVIDNKRIL